MIQLTDAHAHIKNEKQAMERITLGIPTMACAGTPGKMKELEKFGRLPGAEKVLIPACGLHPWYSDKWEPEEMFSLMEKVPVIGAEWTVCGVMCHLTGRGRLWKNSCNLPVRSKSR